MIINKYTNRIQDQTGRTSNWLNDDWIYVETQSELGRKLTTYAPNVELIFDDNGNLIDAKVFINITETQQNKINEMDESCKQTIYNGLDITLEDGTVEHFTLDEQDQLNLSGIGLKLLMGAEIIAWHEDDETIPCRFYSAIDATKIISTLTNWKEYHITYFRDLRIYINSLQTVDEVNAIEYGFALPAEAKSDVLIAYEQRLTSTTNIAN